MARLPRFFLQFVRSLEHRRSRDYMLHASGQEMSRPRSPPVRMQVFLSRKKRLS
jgi:hypothetical protein